METARRRRWSSDLRNGGTARPAIAGATELAGSRACGEPGPGSDGDQRRRVGKPDPRTENPRASRAWREAAAGNDEDITACHLADGGVRAPTADFRSSRAWRVAASGNDGDGQCATVAEQELRRHERPGTGNGRGQGCPRHAHFRSRRCGVTLMELLVAMGVASVTLVISLQLFVATQRVLDRQQVKAARLGQESDVLSLLRRDVRAAAYVAAESTESRLVLVDLDGSKITYETDGEVVRRDAARQSFAWASEALALAPRFEYPGVEGKSGRLVRVTWGPAEARRSITLSLRNHTAS